MEQSILQDNGLLQMQE